MPRDPALAEFIEARYLAAPEDRAQMEPPPLPKTRDGILAALHYMYQNSPWVFLVGFAISVSALLHAAFRVGQWLIG
jgi:hypothetical protein